jgi:transposase
VSRKAEFVVCDQSIERAHSWLVSWRGILVRWEKQPENYLAVIELACALLWFRYYLSLTPWLRA